MITIKSLTGSVIRKTKNTDKGDYIETLRNKMKRFSTQYN